MRMLPVFWRRERDSFLNFSKHFELEHRLCFEKFFGHRSKTTHRVIFSLRSNPYLYSHEKARKHPQMRMLLAFWRRERDSNPRARERKLISSQPRYDHFDISPY